MGDWSVPEIEGYAARVNPAAGAHGAKSHPELLSVDRLARIGRQ